MHHTRRRSYSGRALAYLRGIPKLPDARRTGIRLWQRTPFGAVETLPVLLLTVAIAPGLFWLWYFLKRDHLRPEPRFLIRRIFFLGMGLALAAAIIEWLILSRPALAFDGGSAGSIIIAASVIGLTEEGMKFLAVYLGVYRRTEFNEVLDGIVYAVAASMGFATLENIAYVLQGGIGVGLLRAVLSVPGHAFYGVLLGFNMGMAKFARAAEWPWLISGWLLASLAHALYDAVIFTRTDLAFLVVPLVLVLWRVAVIQSRHARALDDRRIDRG